MEKNERSAECFPIDAGGVVQLLTGIREHVPTFLITIRTKEPVAREKLRDAVNKALDVFQIFKVRLAADGPDHSLVYKYNAGDADVYPYDGRTHAFGEESGGYLFRVYYAGNQVMLSMLHALTDFCGAKEFLKCILCFYYECMDGSPQEIMKHLAVDPNDLRDPYALYGSKDSPGFSMKNKVQNELEIPNRMLYRRNEPTVVRELYLSLAECLKITKRTESSVFPLLTWLIGRATARTYGGEDRILTGTGAFNCRNMFHSGTPRNFSQTFPTALNPRERCLDLQLQLTVQRARMDIELEKGTIMRSIADRREAAERMMENPRQFILDQDSREAEKRAIARKCSYFLSYLGHIDMGDELDQYIEDFSEVNTVTRNPVIAVAWERRGMLTIKIMEAGCEKSIAPAIADIAGELGISCGMTDPCPQCFDSFPLEELVHD